MPSTMPSEEFMIGINVRECDDIEAQNRSTHQSEDNRRTGFTEGHAADMMNGVRS